MRQLRIDLSRCEAGRGCAEVCEQACASKVFKLDDKRFAALRILQGTDAVICDQCGDCLTICPTEALKRNKLGVVVIDKMLCVGCYLCVGICEKGAFERLEGWLEPYKCTACGICVKACPHAALAVADVPTPAPRII
jgi:ferredoxin